MKTQNKSLNLSKFVEYGRASLWWCPECTGRCDCDATSVDDGGAGSYTGVLVVVRSSFLSEFACVFRRIHRSAPQRGPQDALRDVLGARGFRQAPHGEHTSSGKSSVSVLPSESSGEFSTCFACGFFALSPLFSWTTFDSTMHASPSLVDARLKSKVRGPPTKSPSFWPNAKSRGSPRR